MRRIVPLMLLALCIGQGCPAPSANVPSPTVQVDKIPAGVYSGQRTIRGTTTLLGSSEPPTVSTSSDSYTVIINQNGELTDSHGKPHVEGDQLETPFGATTNTETITAIIKVGGYIEVHSFMEVAAPIPTGETIHSSGNSIAHFRLQADGSLAYDMRLDMQSAPYSEGIGRGTWEYSATLYPQ